MPKARARFLRSAREGGRDIGSLDGLVEAVLQWWGYDEMERSPFPSGEPPSQAARKWFEEHLRLAVKGPNRFQWTCPGCHERVEAETNYLHTCMMFDYEYWRFCPRCNDILGDAGDSRTGA